MYAEIHVSHTGPVPAPGATVGRGHGWCQAVLNFQDPGHPSGLLAVLQWAFAVPGVAFWPLASSCLLFLNFFSKFIYLYLFLAALGLCCCARAFSSCGERGLLFVAVRGLLVAVASFVAEHGL